MRKHDPSLKLAAAFFKSVREVETMSKHPNGDPRCSSCTGKHRMMGINAKWRKDFTWMLVAEEGRGMVCFLCRMHSQDMQKSRVRRAVWVDIHCRTLTRLSLVKHKKVSLMV